MGEVVSFGSEVDYTKPNEVLIEILEDLLAQAKEGELRSLAFAAITSNNTISTGKPFEDGTNIFEILGALNYLTNKTIREYIE